MRQFSTKFTCQDTFISHKQSHTDCIIWRSLHSRCDWSNIILEHLQYCHVRLSRFSSCAEVFSFKLMVSHNHFTNTYIRELHFQDTFCHWIQNKQQSQRGRLCVMVHCGKTEVWGQFHQGVWLSARRNYDELRVPGNSLTVSPADLAMKNDMDKMFSPTSPMFVFSLLFPRKWSILSSQKKSKQKYL